MRFTNFLVQLASILAERRNAVAVRYRGRDYTYRDLHQNIERALAYLQNAGLRSGDRVVICTDNKYVALVAHLAAMFGAGIAIPVNPKATPAELRHYVHDSSARFLVISQTQANTVAHLLSDLGCSIHVCLDTDLVGSETTCSKATLPSSDTPCLMIYTSGTTGTPKGVLHTFANLGSALSALSETWQLDEFDAVLDVLPLFHVHGLCFAAQATLLVGGLLLLEDRFDVDETAMRMRQATVFMGVPTIYYRLLKRPDLAELANSWRHVRLFTCGSAPLRAEVLPRLQTILGQPIINRYGMTEAMVITSIPLAGPFIVGSVGLPLPDVSLRIVKETGDAPRGEVGEIILRSPYLFREYWHRPELMRQRFQDGWFYTGDYGYLDERGFLHLVGRKDDLIITSGFNVYPQTIEQVINSYPGVLESVVVGLPDKTRGEIIAALIAVGERPTSEASLRKYLSERLSSYQLPRLIRFVRELPRNPMGKISRAQVRTQLVQELGLSDH